MGGTSGSKWSLGSIKVLSCVLSLGSHLNLSHSSEMDQLGVTRCETMIKSKNDDEFDQMIFGP